MKTTISPYDADSCTVTVTFEQDGVSHVRPVNAVCHDDGGYDRAATAARVAEVARGVEYKIGLGVIANPPTTVTLPPAL